MLRDEIKKLNYRIEELEEKTCPDRQHMWIRTDIFLVGGTGHHDKIAINKYKCKNCGKKIQTTDIIINFTFDEEQEFR